MQLLVPSPGILHAVPVALSLHEKAFDLVLSLVAILPETRNFVVFHCVSEVVEFEIGHLLVVAFREFDVAWLHSVVEEAVVTGGCNFNTGFKTPVAVVAVAI